VVRVPLGGASDEGRVAVWGKEPLLVLRGKGGPRLGYRRAEVLPGHGVYAFNIKAIVPQSTLDNKITSERNVGPSVTMDTIPRTGH